MDVKELLEKNPNINITINVRDLLTFGQNIAKTVLAKKDEKIYTREEVIKLFGVSAATLWRWTKLGIIESKKIGRKVYYPESEIKRLTIKRA